MAKMVHVRAMELLVGLCKLKEIRKREGWFGLAKGNSGQMRLCSTKMSADRRKLGRRWQLAARGKS